MQVKHINENKCELSFTQKEIDGMAKATVYLQEIEKKEKELQFLFKSLVYFLLDIRNGFLQPSN